MSQFNSLFAKLISIILFALSFMLPASPDNLNITVNIDNTEEQIIIAEWQNLTGKGIDTPRFYIEKQENDEWIQIPFLPDFGFVEIATIHYPTAKGKTTVRTEKVFGKELEPGTYRITLYYNLMYSDVATGNANTQFTIE